MEKDRLIDRLKEFGQEHLIRFWDELNDGQRSALTEQIDNIDLSVISRLAQGRADSQDWEAIAARAKAPPAFRLSADGNPFTPKEAIQSAEDALQAGQLGVVLVAGGQGTRLGFPYPKGMYPIGPVSQRTLFQMHIDQMLALSARFSVRIPFYLMTSPATHDETIQFLKQNEFFGLHESDVHFFCQGTMPAVDDDGRILLEKKDSIFLSPDGHGGMLSAFDKSGGIEDATRRGIKHLFYFQVDNPLVSICDRELVGYHLLSESELSTQVVSKTEPDDKVGNVVSVDDKLMVIEYSDLPPAAGQRRNPDGSLELWAGNIAVHVFAIDFLQRMSRTHEALPFHRARKKVKFVDDDGKTIEPDTPNATKFEQFIFDLMPSAKNAIVVEGDERTVFAPLKNASGAAKDTPESTQAAIVQKFTDWLQAVGSTVDPDVAVEISPLYAMDVDQLRERIGPSTHIKEATYFHRES